MKVTPSSKFPTGEPPYAPHSWNKGSQMIKATHNCYSYMLNDLHDVPRIHGKPQPGAWKSSHAIQNLLNSNKRLSCSQVLKGVNQDNPHITILPLKEGLSYKCKPGYYKGFMMVSPGRDYHFARQDNKLIKVYRIIHKHYRKEFLNSTKGKQKKILLQLIQKHLPKIFYNSQLIFPNMNSQKDRLRALFKSAHTWSHKPGATNAVDTDADKKLISNGNRGEITAVLQKNYFDQVRGKRDSFPEWLFSTD